jgi:hypothetical protein
MSKVLEGLNTQLEEKRQQLQDLLESGKDIVHEEIYELECEALTSEIDSILEQIERNL